jgi:hypothetical protein
MSQPTISSAAAPAAPSVAGGAPAPSAMPLFFSRVVGVNPTHHAHLRLDRSVGFGFSRGAQSVPIGLGEFEVVAQHYPIVFASGPVPTPVALLGLGDGGNLFVHADGTWRRDAYIPAYVRAFPFIFVEDGATRTVYVGMEADAALIREDSGLPMFEDGKPTPALTEAINFCSAFRDNLNAAATFARALDAQGLLQEEEATVNFTAGGGTRVRGFKVIRPDRLEQVSDETFIDWRRRGWIGPLYAHLHSAARWGRLIELAAAERAAA